MTWGGGGERERGRGERERERERERVREREREREEWRGKIEGGVGRERESIYRTKGDKIFSSQT